MTDTPNLPPLPEPFTFCYDEWDGPYDMREFSVATHNGRDPDRAVAIYTAAQVEEIRRAAILAERERNASVSAMREALEQIEGIDAVSPEGGREEIAEIHAIARAALRAVKDQT